MQVPLGYFSTVRDIEEVNDSNTFFVNRYYHQVITGETGVGKSSLIENQSIDLIQGGEGCAIIDPDGDLVRRVAGCIPESRWRDVIYFYPLSPNAIGLNPFDGESVDLAIDALKDLIQTLFPFGWGPQTEEIINNGCYALADSISRITVPHFRRFYLDGDYRNYIVQKCRDNAVAKYFENFSELKVRDQLEKTSHPLNKFNKLVGDSILAPIIGQKNCISFRQVIDGKKIFLADLAEGEIGPTRSRILGSLITHKFTRAFLSRSHSKKRGDYSVFIDEFLSFMGCTDPTTLLARSRKYGGRFTLATQTFGPLMDGDTSERQLLHTILGNCATKVCYRVSDADAELFMKNYKPTMQDTSELINLNNFEFYARSIGPKGVLHGPKKCVSFPPIKPDDAVRDRVIAMSCSQHGTPREVLLEAMNEFMAGKARKG